MVYVTGTAVVSMSGLHIRQGNYDNGGAVFVGSSVLTMSGNLIYSSTATNGGAFYNQGTLYLVNDNQLFGNTATNGGGVYNAAGQSILDDNDFQEFLRLGGHDDKCTSVVGNVAKWTVEILEEIR